MQEQEKASQSFPLLHFCVIRAVNCLDGPHFLYIFFSFHNIYVEIIFVIWRHCLVKL